MLYPVIIPIPYGSKFVARISGSAIKTVACEKCNGQYQFEVYVENCEGSAEAPLWLRQEQAKQAAIADAHDTLEQYVERMVIIEHCRHCGWYQRAMVKEIEHKRRGEVYRDYNK